MYPSTYQGPFNGAVIDVLGVKTYTAGDPTKDQTVNCRITPPKRSTQMVSQGRPAAQISTTNGAPAARAVDGKTNGDWSGGSVIHTNTHCNAWWRVDLGKAYAVKEVHVWNRYDCCWERLATAVVRVSHSATIMSGVALTPYSGNFGRGTSPTGPPTMTRIDSSFTPVVCNNSVMAVPLTPMPSVWNCTIYIRHAKKFMSGYALAY